MKSPGEIETEHPPASRIEDASVKRNPCDGGYLAGSTYLLQYARPPDTMHRPYDSTHKQPRIQVVRLPCSTFLSLTDLFGFDMFDVFQGPAVV